MLWVCRAGKDACFIDMYLKDNRIYIPWEGFSADLSYISDDSIYKEIVANEMRDDSTKVAIATWAGQLRYFIDEMNLGDYVIVPDKRSRYFHLARIEGEYEFIKDNILHHSRKVTYLVKEIPSSIFKQTLKYSLGAYKNIFKAKKERELLETILTWKKNGNGGK